MRKLIELPKLTESDPTLPRTCDWIRYVTPEGEVIYDEFLYFDSPISGLREDAQLVRLYDWETSSRTEWWYEFGDWQEQLVSYGEDSFREEFEKIAGVFEHRHPTPR